MKINGLSQKHDARVSLEHECPLDQLTRWLKARGRSRSPVGNSVVVQTFLEFLQESQKRGELLIENPLFLQLEKFILFFFNLLLEVEEFISDQGLLLTHGLELSINVTLPDCLEFSEYSLVEPVVDELLDPGEVFIIGNQEAIEHGIGGQIHFKLLLLYSLFKLLHPASKCLLWRLVCVL